MTDDQLLGAGLWAIVVAGAVWFMLKIITRDKDDA